MKKLFTLLLTIIILSNTHVLTAEKKRIFKPWGSKKSSTNSSISSGSNQLEKEKERIFRPWGSKKNSQKDNSVMAQENKTFKKINAKNNRAQNFSVYTGTFDVIDKEGDEQTSLVGFEHKNQDLFRNTWVGKFSPTTGAFFTGKNSMYLYTGVEADYNLGPISVSPSFAPGYYEAGDGKNLGSPLEFKSEVKIGIDLLKNSKLGYSYSHISNNDWGDVNPGTDNQSVTFTKKF